jgi:hypothetical protein
VDQQLALTLACHLPASLDRLRLGVVHLGRALPTLAEGAPAVFALNDVNVFPVRETLIYPG